MYSRVWRCPPTRFGSTDSGLSGRSRTAVRDARLGPEQLVEVADGHPRPVAEDGGVASPAALQRFELRQQVVDRRFGVGRLRRSRPRRRTSQWFPGRRPARPP